MAEFVHPGHATVKTVVVNNPLHNFRPMGLKELGKSPRFDFH
jgi:hypothetical protein